MKDLLGKVHTGDCVTFQKDKLPAQSVDLIVADPPFNVGFEYDVYEDRKSYMAYLAWSRQWLQGAVNSLTPDGSLWICIGDEYAAELKILARELGLHFRSWVILYFTFGVNCSRNFSRSHTHLLYFTRHRTKFTFQLPDVRLPSARQTIYNDKRANPQGRLPDNTWIIRPQEAPYLFEEGGNIWHCPRICGTFKSRARITQTQMPEQVLGRIIRLCSKPGDIVYDPMIGSGTTLAVAKKLGRQFLGCELSRSYARQAQQRINGVSKGDPLLHPDIQGAPVVPAEIA